MDHAHEAFFMPNGRRRVALHEMRLTTRTVADARPRDRRYIVWDDELTGFGARISPSGLRSFIVQYRMREGGCRAASADHDDLRNPVAEWRMGGDNTRMGGTKSYGTGDLNRPGNHGPMIRRHVRPIGANRSRCSSQRG